MPHTPPNLFPLFSFFFPFFTFFFYLISYFTTLFFPAGKKRVEWGCTPKPAGNGGFLLSRKLHDGDLYRALDLGKEIKGTGNPATLRAIFEQLLK